MTKFRTHIAGEAFFRNATPYHHFRLGLGESEKRPFKLFVPIMTDNFGDIANVVHLVLQYAGRFAHSIATFAFTDNRPYKRHLLALYPLPYQSIILTAAEGLNQLNIPFFAPRHKVKIGDETTYRTPEDIVMDRRWHDVIFPPAHQHQVLNFDRPLIPCQIPQQFESRLHHKLVELGLKDDRWFCCMHYREPNYHWKHVPNFRDCDPAVYLPLIDYVIDRLGGQVVRLGHPEMRDHPARPGFVDLAKIRDSTFLQAFAASRARFSVMGPGGGTCLVRIFHTPLGLTDAGGWFDGVENQHYLLTHTVVTPEGVVLRQEALFESGLMNQRALEIEIARRPGYKIIKNTTEQLCQVADFMYEITTDVAGWRDRPEAPKPIHDNKFTWPIGGDVKTQFIDL